jgi:glycyl-tRNA synthetase
VQKSGRMKVPFGIAQTGKRLEIVARQFYMREFEQMEMQFFASRRRNETFFWKSPLNGIYHLV